MPATKAIMCLWRKSVNHPQKIITTSLLNLPQFYTLLVVAETTNIKQDIVRSNYFTYEELLK